ncbi:MAG: zf-TFIIB domain-containing protein [Parcubacteria group bacterium]
MKCPLCEVDLQMMERQGVEIDYCPKCRGVWLDRGELDKVIEKSTVGAPVSTPERHQGMPVSNDQRGHYDEHNDHHAKQGYGYGGKRKKEGLLGELFDF